MGVGGCLTEVDYLRYGKGELFVPEWIQAFSSRIPGVPDETQEFRRGRAHLGYP